MTPEEQEALSRAPSDLNLAKLGAAGTKAKSDLQLAPEDKWIPSLDIETFAAELKDLGKKLAAQQGSEDAEHLYKIVRWSRTCTAVGLLTSVWIVNPISVALLALGCMTRWTIVAHHVCHGGFDKVNTGGRYNRFSFGVGSLWRRCTDWLDWMLVEAWNIEHNTLHHYHLGESGDPDLVERNMEMVRDAPRWLLPFKYVAMVWNIMTWKWFYYAPNTFKVLKLNESRRKGIEVPFSKKSIEAPCAIFSWYVPGYDKFFTNVEFFGRVLGPFFFARFVAVPALAALIVSGGASALFGATPAAAAALARSTAQTSLVNLFLGEILTNVWAFIVIVTNHAGDDLYRFEGHAPARSASFYLRQTISSVNFRTGGAEGGFWADLNDFMHGWLNYQIEHHLWPDLSMRSYQKAAPLVQAICKKHGVPYVQHNVFWRFKQTIDISVGNSSMRRFPVEHHHSDITCD